jgi:hypothetical protein
VSHGPPSAEPALLRPILVGVDGTLAQVTVIDVPLAEAVKDVEGAGALTVRVVVPTDPAKGPKLVPLLPMI